MSLVRLCMHDIQSPTGREDIGLVAEPVAGYGFVEDVDKVYPASYGYSGPKVSTQGISSSLFVASGKQQKFVTAQHLLTTPEKESRVPVAHATPSLANKNRPNSAWIALRAMPDETRFVETLVSREELLDTFTSPEQ